MNKRSIIYIYLSCALVLIPLLFGCKYKKKCVDSKTKINYPQTHFIYSETIKKLNELIVQDSFMALFYKYEHLYLIDSTYFQTHNSVQTKIKHDFGHLNLSEILATNDSLIFKFIGDRTHISSLLDINEMKKEYAIKVIPNKEISSIKSSQSNYAILRLSNIVYINERYLISSFWIYNTYTFERDLSSCRHFSFVFEYNNLELKFLRSGGKKY